MDRRTFIGSVAGGLLAVPLATRAQKPPIPVIGYLGSTSPATSNPHALTGFKAGLAETGYVEGKNVASTPQGRNELTQIPLVGLSMRPLEMTFGDDDDPSFGSFQRFLGA